MNPLDRKLAGVLKALNIAKVSAKVETAGKDYRQIRGRVVDERIGGLLDDLFGEFSKPADQRSRPDATRATEMLNELRSREFVDTARVLVVAWMDALAQLPLKAFVNVAPDARSIALWCKKTKTKAEAAQQELASDSATSYATAAGDWLLQTGKPSSLAPLLALFLTRQSRPKFLPSWSEALATALAKDKRGALLGFILQHDWAGPDRLEALAEMIRLDRTALQVAVENIPQIAERKDAKPSVAELVKHLATAALLAEGAERKRLTASLARIGTGIVLSGKSSPAAEAVLSVILESGRHVLTTTRADEAKQQTWILQNLAAPGEKPSGGLHVTLEGAQHLAVAFEKADQGFGPRDVLTVAARNLGLTPIGRKGDPVIYNPIEHEDVTGGLLPGDKVVFQEEGWRWRNEILMRAKVAASEGERNV